MARFKHILPDNLVPEDDVCYPLFIPDDPQYIQLLVRQLRQLTLDRMWQRDDENNALIVRQQWNDRMYQPFIDALAAGEHCGDEDEIGTCWRVGNESATFLFEPNNPFDGSDQRQTSLAARWRRYSDLNNFDVLPDWIQAAIDVLGDNIGYFPNDVFVSYTDRGIFNKTDYQNFWEFVSSIQVFPFPVVKWMLHGEGEFEIELLNVPLGGAVLITWDLTLDLAQIYDILQGKLGDEGDNWFLFELNRDITSVPPELVPTLIQEIKFDEFGDHVVQALFSPRINDELPFYFPFGGIREIEVCGNLELIDWNTNEPVNQVNYGLSQHSQKGVIQTMTADEVCEGVICAIEKIAQRILLGEDKDNILSSVTIDKDTGDIKLVQADVDKEDIKGSSQEKRFGGVYYQALQVAQLFTDINDYVDVPYGVSTIQTLTKSFVDIDPIDDIDLSTDWDDAILQYVNANPQFDIDVDALSLRYFCNSLASGNTKYAIDDEGFTEANLNLFIDLLKLIPKTTYSAWYRDGSLTPKDGYQSAPCYRFPTAEMTYDTDDLSDDEKAFTIQPNLTVGSAINDRRRLYRVAIAGALIGDNYRWDGQYLTALPSGVPQYDPLLLRHIEGGVNVGGAYDPDVPPAFNPASGYETTYTFGFVTPNALRLYGIQVPTEIQTDTNISGALIINVLDLGHPDA